MYSRYKQFAVISFILFFLATSLHAEVFYAIDEALELAFPQAESIAKKTFILTDAQREAVEKLANTKIESKLFTFFIGKQAGRILGYAAIETQIVRTHPETLLVVLNANGVMQKAIVLAFHEPPEYLPSKKWLAQFEDKSLAADLAPGKDIAGIFGSTLSANAAAGAIRKVLALHSVLL